MFATHSCLILLQVKIYYPLLQISPFGFLQHSHLLFEPSQVYSIEANSSFCMLYAWGLLIQRDDVPFCSVGWHWEGA